MKFEKLLKMVDQYYGCILQLYGLLVITTIMDTETITCTLSCKTNVSFNINVQCGVTKRLVIAGQWLMPKIFSRLEPRDHKCFVLYTLL